MAVSPGAVGNHARCVREVQRGRLERIQLEGSHRGLGQGDQITAPGATLYADEHTYFLTKREPPSGMEYMDSHKLKLPDAVAEKMHVLSTAKLDEQVAAGKFATISICNNGDRITALGLPGPYTQKDEIAACDVFWARK